LIDEEGRIPLALDWRLCRGGVGNLS